MLTMEFANFSEKKTKGQEELGRTMPGTPRMASLNERTSVCGERQMAEAWPVPMSFNGLIPMRLAHN